MSGRGFTLRARLLGSVLGAIGLVLAALALGFNLVLAARLDSDANDLARARASAELAALRVSAGRILLPESPDGTNPDVQVWVFAGRRTLEQPRSTPAGDAAAARLAARAPSFSDLDAMHTRLYSLPVVQGRKLGAVVVAESLLPYEQTRRTALVASIILALGVLAAVGLAARWLIGRALRPVARITRQAAEWSEHDLDRRFAVGPAEDELAELARTLNGLLERLATSLRREQRLSAEISHELRTPLSNIIAETQFALRHGSHTDEGAATLEQILLSGRQLGRTLDTLLVAARAQLDPQRGTSDAVAGAEAAVLGFEAAVAGVQAAVAGVEAEAANAGHADTQLRLTVKAEQRPLRVAVEQDLVERILAPLIENAARHARVAIEVTVTREGDEVLLSVVDDGPGVPADERELIFEPGHRAFAPAGGTATATGAGLGLALCRRLARSAGGEVSAEPGELGGRFVVRLRAL